MPKIPYIPIYIGDWEQDTNCISLEAEGALLKLVFKLFKSDTYGLLSISFSQIALLLKKPEEIALKIVRELQENDILNIVFLPENKIKIESRRMVKEAELSKTRSQTGSLGGRPKKETKSKRKPKVKQNTDIDNDIDNEVVIENNLKSVGKKSEIINSKIWVQSIAVQKKLPEPDVIDFLKEFIEDLILKDDFNKPDREVKKHFISWLNIKLSKKSKQGLNPVQKTFNAYQELKTQYANE